jgi:hypothetical protein
MKLLALAALCGCSFLVVSGPDTPDPTGKFTKLDCDEGSGPAIIDILAVGGLLIGSASALVGTNDRAAALIPGALVLPFAASAFYGFHETHKCTRLREAVGVPGHEGAACHPTAGCDPGLVCASQLCVRLPDGGV